jgi:hypothetical protein
MEKDEVATIQIPIPADEQADQSSHKADEVGSSKYNENWYLVLTSKHHIRKINLCAQQEKGSSRP